MREARDHEEREPLPRVARAGEEEVSILHMGDCEIHEGEPVVGGAQGAACREREPWMFRYCSLCRRRRFYCLC